MQGERYDQIMRETAPDYRPPPEPRLDHMWERIQARVFDAPRWEWPPWRTWARPLAFAATFVLGVALGVAASRLRLPAPADQAAALDQFVPPVSSPGPFVGVARDYLQETTALLIPFAREIQGGPVPDATIGQARRLLSTTRLLLDAGVADPALLALLEDLELVLAQVVVLPGNRQPPDAVLITEALDEHQVVRRLGLMLAHAGGAQ